jgi:cyanate permease
VIVPAIMKRVGEVLTIAGAIVLIGAACLLMMTSWLAVVLAGSAVLGTSIMFANVAAITLIQRRTRPELMGRVDAALTFASTGPQAISIAVGAALITVVSYRLLLAAITVMMVVACAYWLAGQGRQADAAPSEAPLLAAAARPRETAK